jgi:hypothetical protein
MNQPERTDKIPEADDCGVEASTSPRARLDGVAGQASQHFQLSATFTNHESRRILNMSTTLEPDTKLDDGTMNQWPPLAHIARKRPGTVREGDIALCGAKLMGLNLNDAHKVCEECIKIARQELQGQ